MLCEMAPQVSFEHEPSPCNQPCRLGADLASEAEILTKPVKRMDIHLGHSNWIRK